MIRDGDEVRFDWRRGGAAAVGLIAALILLGMVFLVADANKARENALDAERHSYEVALVVRNDIVSIDLYLIAISAHPSQARRLRSGASSSTRRSAQAASIRATGTLPAISSGS